MELTEKERALFINQYKILGLLDGGNADYYKQLVTILENGYELEYGKLTYNLPAPLREEDCREVLDILDMFEALQDSYARLADKSGIEEWKVSFMGFSHNTESPLMGYVEYLIKDNRFAHVVKRENLSGPCPNLDRYRGMLERFRKFQSPHTLSKEHILQIIG